MQGDVWVAPGGIFGAGVIGENIINAWVQKKSIVPGFWTHQWHPIQFMLVFDNFGVKCTCKEHAKNMIIALK